EIVDDDEQAGAVLGDVVEKIQKREDLEQQQETSHKQREIVREISQQIKIEKLREAASAANPGHRFRAVRTRTGAVSVCVRRGRPSCSRSLSQPLPKPTIAPAQP